MVLAPNFGFREKIHLNRFGTNVTNLLINRHLCRILIFAERSFRIELVPTWRILYWTLVPNFGDNFFTRWRRKERMNASLGVIAIRLRFWKWYLAVGSRQSPCKKTSAMTERGKMAAKSGQASHNWGTWCLILQNTGVSTLYLLFDDYVIRVFKLHSLLGVVVITLF